MSFTHRLLRKPFFGRFEIPWRMPEGASESKWQLVWPKMEREMRPERHAAHRRQSRRAHHPR
jgi:hypothetical protein